MSFSRPDRLPRPQQLLRRHRTTQISLVVFTALSSLGAVALVVLYLDVQWLLRHWFIVLLIVGMLSYANLWPIFRLMKRKKIPISRATADECGGHDPRELAAVFCRLRDSFQGREDPALYVLPREERSVNAFAINALLLGNLFRSLNAVYLTRPLLGLLNRREIEAILAHELAHFYGATYLINRIDGLLVFCIAVFALAAVKPMTFDESVRGVFLAYGLASGVSWLVGKAITAISDRHKYIHEFLSDYRAAQRVGHLPMINALLKMDLRQELLEEVLYRVLTRAKDHPTWDVDAIMERVSDKLPERSVNIAEVEDTVEEILAEVQANPPYLENREEKVVETLREVMQNLIDELDRLREGKQIPWTAFDNLVPDGELDERELTHYVRALLDSPDARVSRSVSEVEGEIEGKVMKLPDSHPRTRRRILFLAQEFLLPRAESTPSGHR